MDLQLPVPGETIFDSHSLVVLRLITEAPEEPQTCVQAPLRLVVDWECTAKIIQCFTLVEAQRRIMRQELLENLWSTHIHGMKHKSKHNFLMPLHSCSRRLTAVGRIIMHQQSRKVVDRADEMESLHCQGSAFLDDLVTQKYDEIDSRTTASVYQAGMRACHSLHACCEYQECLDQALEYMQNLRAEGSVFVGICNKRRTITTALRDRYIEEIQNYENTNDVFSAKAPWNCFPSYSFGSCSEHWGTRVIDWDDIRGALSPYVPFMFQWWGSGSFNNAKSSPVRRTHQSFHFEQLMTALTIALHYMNIAQFLTIILCKVDVSPESIEYATTRWKETFASDINLCEISHQSVTWLYRQSVQQLVQCKKSLKAWQGSEYRSHRDRNDLDLYLPECTASILDALLYWAWCYVSQATPIYFPYQSMRIPQTALLDLQTLENVFHDTKAFARMSVLLDAATKMCASECYTQSNTVCELFDFLKIMASMADANLVAGQCIIKYIYAAKPRLYTTNSRRLEQFTVEMIDDVHSAKTFEQCMKRLDKVTKAVTDKPSQRPRGHLRLITSCINTLVDAYHDILGRIHMVKVLST